MCHIDRILAVFGVFIVLLIGSCGNQREAVNEQPKLVIEQQKAQSQCRSGVSNNPRIGFMTVGVCSFLIRAIVRNTGTDKAQAVFVTAECPACAKRDKMDTEEWSILVDDTIVHGLKPGEAREVLVPVQVTFKYPENIQPEWSVETRIKSFEVSEVSQGKYSETESNLKKMLARLENASKKEEQAPSQGTGGSDWLKVKLNAALHNLGELYMSQRRWADAEQVLNRYLKISPLDEHRPDQFSLVAEVYIKQGKQAQARLLLERALPKLKGDRSGTDASKLLHLVNVFTTLAQLDNDSGKV